MVGKCGRPGLFPGMIRFAIFGGLLLGLAGCTPEASQWDEQAPTSGRADQKSGPGPGKSAAENAVPAVPGQATPKVGSEPSPAAGQKPSPAPPPSGEPAPRGPGLEGFGPGPGGPGGGFFPGPQDPATLETVKAQIKASDEEWKVIGPKLRKVIAACLASETGIHRPGAMGNRVVRGGFGGRGPGGGPGFGPDSFSGPKDSAQGGFGPGGPGGRGPGRFGGPGPGGFGPPEGFGPPNAQRPDNGGTPAGPAPRTDKDGPSAGPRAGSPAGPGNSESAPAAKAQAPNAGPGGRGQPPVGGPGGAGGPPPGFGPPGFGGDSAISQALTELQAALAEAKTSPEQLREKVAAVRSARQKARAKFEAARKELLELLTADQEAVLVQLGYLE